MNNNDYGSKVKKVISLLKNDPISKQYFFNKTEVDSKWFDSLNEVATFDFNSLSQIQQFGERIEYPRWIEGDYLIRVTKDIPRKIIKLVFNFDTSQVENPLIKEKLIEIIILLVEQLEENDLYALIKRIADEKWFDSNHLNMMPFKLEDLFKVLVKRKFLKSLLILIPSVLKFNKPKGNDKSNSPKPLFDEYLYQHILKSVRSLNAEIKEKKILREIIFAITRILDQYISIENEIRYYKKGNDDTSIVWKPVINESEDEYTDLDESLLDTIRDLILTNIDHIQIDLLVDITKEYRYPVFKRLVLYLISKGKYDSNAVIPDILEWIKIKSVTNEMRLILSEYYFKLSDKNKSKVLDAIDNMIDLDDLISSRRHLIRKGFIDNENELEIQAKEYVNILKRHYLKPIENYLDETQKNRYAEILKVKDNYTPYMFSRDFKSGPNSRLAIAEIQAASVKELVELFKEDAVWFVNNTQNENMYSPWGTARAWYTDILERPLEYLANISLFKPTVELPPIYLEYLFRGFEEVVLQKKLPLPELIPFISDVIKEYTRKSFTEFPIMDDTGRWEEVIIAIFGFLKSALSINGVIDNKFEDTIWEIIDYGLNFQSSEIIINNEERDSNNDYDTQSINSVYGLALHSLINYVSWKAKATRIKAGLSKPVQKIIKRELKKNIKTTYSVIGQHFPTIYYNDKKFGVSIKDRLFNNKNKSLSYIALDTYLSTGVYKEIAIELKDYYINSITHLNSLPQSEYKTDLVQKLINHVMIIYLHGFKGGVQMKHCLFEQSLDIRKYAIEFVGRSYVSSEKKQENSNIVIEKVKQLWHEALNEDSLEYGEQFGWWLNENFFTDTTWMLSMLIGTLKITDGVIYPEFKVLKSLANLSKNYTKECLDVLILMIKGDNPRKTLYLDSKEILEIIQNAESKEDERLSELTEEIRNELVRYGFLKYHDI